MKETKQEMIEKIRKILALAENNPEKNEAIAAALHAQKLMAKYHIEQSELGQELKEENIDSLECVLSGKTMKWRLGLAAIIGRNFRCRVYLNYAGNVTFYGFEEDAKIAREVFISLYNIGVKLSNKMKREARKETGTASGVRNTFCLGFVDGIRAELEKQCTALMIVVPKEVDEKYKEQFTFTRTTSTSMKVSSDREMYNKGFQEGRDAIRSKGIEGK